MTATFFGRDPTSVERADSQLSPEPNHDNSATDLNVANDLKGGNFNSMDYNSELKPLIVQSEQDKNLAV